MNRHVIRSATAAFLLFCLFLATACSYTVIPATLPASAVDQITACSDSSILIRNAEANSMDSPIRRDGNGRSDLRTSRKAWSNKIVEYLAAELARQGCRVQANAGLVVSISLPDIILKEDLPAAQFTVKMLAASSTGWSKTYEGTAKTNRVSASSDADLLIVQAFGETARKMLNDAEFQEQLLRK
jgi:hypothetical protein